MERSICLECGAKLDEEWIANLCGKCIRNKNAGGISRQLEQRVGLCDEECKLIAHATGDGWHLAVLNRDDVEIAMLDFNKVIPKRFNGYITASELRNLGYEIV